MNACRFAPHSAMDGARIDSIFVKTTGWVVARPSGSPWFRHGHLPLNELGLQGALQHLETRLNSANLLPFSRRTLKTIK